MIHYDPNEYCFAGEAKNIVNRMAPYNDGSQVWSNPMWSVWSRNYYAYFSTVVRPQDWDTGLVFRGKQGELIEVLVPLAKSLTEQTVEIVTKQNLLFKCLADSTAPNVIQTARLGSALCKQIVREKSVDIRWSESFEHELVTGLGFLYVKWRTDKGGIFGRDKNGQIHFKGDVEITSPTVYDVLFDPSICNPDNWQWVQIREIHNRWDLIAQFPDMKKSLLALPPVNISNRYTAESMSPSSDDNVYIYAFYHTPSPSLPEGRMIVYGDQDTVLVDDVNLYGELPLYCSRGRPIPLSSYGDPYFSQLLASQEMLDTTVSAVCTNNASFAVQNVIHPKGSGIQVEQILGMNFFGYRPENIPGGGKPEALQLTKSAPETYQLITLLENFLMKVSRINGALRGDPPSQVSSGVAIATLTATALESINASAKTSRKMLDKAMNGAINCYRRFASVDRPVEVSGIGGQSSMQNFNGSDLDPIRFVELQTVNPLMQTLPGRMEIAKDMLGSGLITNQRGYFGIIEGAPIEELYKNELSQEDLVNHENQEMLEGGQPIMVNTDDHPYHIMMHSMILNDPKVRHNTAVASLILKHILEHNQAVHLGDPVLQVMARTGKAPDPTLLQPPMMMGNPTGPGQPAAPGKEPPGSQEPATPTAAPAAPAKDLLQRTGS